MSRILLSIVSVFVFVLVGYADVPFNGMIFDSQGKPMKGVKVYVHNPNRFATSDKEGKFGLTDVQPDDTLRLKVKKRKLPYLVPVEGRKSMKILLANENNIRVEEDEELVDLGYGFVKKRECTQPRNGISGEDLVRTGQRDILSALKGKVPGLDITSSGVTLRGVHSLMASNEPLYVVDGIVVPNFNGISIYDVDYVEVMKDASIYGSRGANGAILVHTKSALQK